MSQYLATFSKDLTYKHDSFVSKKRRVIRKYEHWVKKQLIRPIKSEFKDIVEREGNIAVWKHVGLVCIVKRNVYFGSFCGYVGVEKGHPMFNKNYFDVPADVHGGITFADWGVFQNKPVSKRWWIGFDAFHSNDLSPVTSAYSFSQYYPGTYKDMEFMVKETNSLAEQLRNLA